MPRAINGTLREIATERAAAPERSALEAARETLGIPGAEQGYIPFDDRRIVNARPRLAELEEARR